jgi:transposase-like protein
MGTCPKSSWPAAKAMLHAVYDQPEADQVQAQYDKLLDAVAGKLPGVHAHLDAARADLLAFTGFPKEIWRQIWSNNLGRTTQPGDPAPHRRRGHLPRPRLRDPPGRRRPGRAARAFGPKDAATSPWTS